MMPETNENVRPDFQRRPSGLVRGEEGQITVIFALVSMALVFFWMSVYQTGEVVSERIKVQDTADACAYSGAVWGARMLNLIAYTNRAIIANIVSMTELVIARSHSKFWLDIAVIIELISTALSWIPILGPILNVVASILTVIAMAYDLLTYALFNIAIRTPTQFLQGPKLELWFLFLHNLCALENTIHWMLAPPPINGVYMDTGAISSAIDTALIPIAIKKTNEMIDPRSGGNKRIWVNPSVSDGVPLQVGVMSQIFRQRTLQSYNDLLAWPGGAHGTERGNGQGEYKPGKRKYGTRSAFNKTIDQKWRLKWLIEETGKRRLTGLWAWNRGAEGEGMSALSMITNLWFVGFDIGGTTNVDELRAGPIQIINFMGGKVFVRAGGPPRMQNDRDIEATDYIRVWYRQFWKLFKFPKKTLFQAGEIALLSEESFPAFCTIPSSCAISSFRVNTYNQLKNNDRYRKTGYRGLPHEDNRNHVYKIFGMDGGTLGNLEIPAPNPLDHFPTLGFDPDKTKQNRTYHRPSGIHELNNDMFQQNSRNRGERAIWRSSGSPGFRGQAWFAADLPSYCFVLDARKPPGGDSRRFYIPKEMRRNQSGEQFGKRCGTVVTVAYKAAAGMPIVEIMGQGTDAAPAEQVTYRQQARTDANMKGGESLRSRSTDWEQKEVNLDMIHSGKFNWLQVGGPSLGMEGLTAFAAAETFYENPGNPEEPPNEMNPCWRARLAPMDAAFAAMLEGGPAPGQTQAMKVIKEVVNVHIKLMQKGWGLLGGRQTDIDLTTLMTH